MSSSRTKTKSIAILSAEWFFLRNAFKGKSVYWWTFTEPGREDSQALWSKDEAEQHFKPFRDLCKRRGIELLVFWEQQKRGSWHPHCLLNDFLDVTFVRAWMMARGWGQQMRVDWVWRPHWDRHQNMAGVRRVTGYVSKYVNKSRVAVYERKKKLFSGTATAKCGTVKFQWMPNEFPSAYLYSVGRSLFFQLYDKLPRFRDVNHCIRLAVEELAWWDVDPTWELSLRGMNAPP